ncbi:hypothetical protein [Fimbriimonas ginsengisoli]|uniref:Outer membrane protein beta-barrel domain-containing protein n=1 Tax=Fimbriimonas ginsengisoli Gsoil 348 TaxID=661478 RepID=A0A068NQD0_FIMGI|nr:hypothetical protein [Fimbriimonas ginsengisoli]AIE84960.1 hypothetical protein OP10G_1592 [Fimbriimonas ginsengisoli Gsoil 348]
MRKIYTVAATIAAIGIAGVAAAQSPTQPDLTPVNITVRAGIALPLDSALTNVGNTLLDLGVEYMIPTSLVKGSETFISLDYWTKGFNGNGNVIPLMVNQRWYQGGADVLKRRYFFLGAGVAFVDVNRSNTAIGIRGGIGQELGEHIVAEIAGYLSDRAGGARANAITFSLGYRF